MRKVNAITQNPEIMKGVYSVHDGRFIANKYGYMANIRDPEILAEYERFRASRKARILSDEERFFFDIQMIKKYRPELVQAVEEFERKEGTALLKIVTSDSGTGVALCFDQGRLDDNGALCEYMIKYPDREHPGETVKQWESDEDAAVCVYGERVTTILHSRLHPYKIKKQASQRS